MNRYAIIIVAVLSILCFSASSYSEFRFQEARFMGGISQTELKLMTVLQPDIIPAEKSVKKYGLPLGVRFGLGDAEKGYLIRFGGFIQPIFSGKDLTKFYVQPGVLGSGYVEHNFWDMGIMVDLVYRFKQYVPGLFFGAGISGHRITAESTFNPPFYIFEDMPLPWDKIDNSEFRTGFQIILGYNLYKGLDLEGRYEIINDFNQLKIGLTIAIWRLE